MQTTESLKTLTDTELSAELQYWSNIYRRADSSEAGVKKANDANWCVTLCLNEQRRRRIMFEQAT